MAVKRYKQANLPNSEVNLLKLVPAVLTLHFAGLTHPGSDSTGSDSPHVISLSVISCKSLIGILETRGSALSLLDEGPESNFTKQCPILIVSTAERCCQEVQTNLYKNQRCKFQREVWLSAKPYKLLKLLLSINPEDSAHTNIVQLTLKSTFVIISGQFLSLPCDASPKASGNSYMASVLTKS